MKPRDAILNAIRHRQVQPVPFCVGAEAEVEKRLDEYYGCRQWREWCNPYVTFVGAVDTDARTPIDAARVRDNYGGIWRVDRRPLHLEKPALEQPSMASYAFPAPERFYRPEWKAKAFDTCRDRADRFLVANLGWGLFERSWDLRGFENILMDVLTEPDFFEEALDKLMELYLAFVRYTAELPVDAIFFGDDWGDQRGVIIGPDRWRRFLKPRWARIYQTAHDAGKLVMHHSCGSVADIMPDIIEIGIDVLESVQPEAAGMNPFELKARWGDKITFWGCLGSQSALPRGTPAEVRAEVAALVGGMGRGGGFVLAPAKALQPETPTENAVALVEACRELMPE